MSCRAALTVVFGGVKFADHAITRECSYMATEHPDYALLGGRVAVSMLHNKTKEKFSEVFTRPTRPLQPAHISTSSLLPCLNLAAPAPYRSSTTSTLTSTRAQVAALVSLGATSPASNNPAESMTKKRF